MKTTMVLPDEELSRRLPPPDADAGFGALLSSRGCLPLKALDVRVRLEGLLAQTDVRQTFVNAFDVPLEATYIFPLPDRAAVTTFRMEIGGRVIDGLLKERGQARREYDEAIQAGHRAGITEEERPGVFTLRVGNLMPGETAVVHLTLVGPLTYDDGEATFRFPLVVAPRYIPGTPLPGPCVGDGVAADSDAVPDASRISPPVLLPGFPNPVALSLVVNVPPGPVPAEGFRSSLHALLSEPAGAGWQLRVQPGERLDRDFILRYRLADGSLRSSLAVRPDREGDEGTFVLTLLPPAGSGRQARPRDVVFVLDRSGSMGGWKMVAARRAVGRMIDTLSERDRFTVYAFDDRLEAPPAAGGLGLMTASDRNRFRTIEYLAGIDARGGTEMAQPLEQAARQLAEDGGRDRVLVLVTDGQVGNEDQILRTLGPRLAGLRVFTLGVDRAVNEGFLRRLAALGGGSCDLVESEDRLDEVMDKVQRRVGEPILTGLALESGGLAVVGDSLVPPRLPDLFAGAPLTVMGRYRGAAGPIRLSGRDDAGRPWSQSLSAVATDHPALAPVWARGMLRALEDRYAVGERNPEQAAKRIVDVSLRFGVLCRFTAFVAVDRSQVVNAGGSQHTILQPVEAPSGWGLFGADKRELRACSLGAPAPACSPLAAPANDSLASLEAATDFDESESRSQSRSRGVSGLFGRFKKRARQEKARKETLAKAAPMDLSAYHRIAHELLGRLEAASDGERLRVLGVVAVRLADLLDDLRSVGAAATVIDPLRRLLDELNKLSSAASVSDADRDSLWTRAHDALQHFSGTADAGKGSPPRKEAFWK